MPTVKTTTVKAEWCEGKALRTVYHLDKRRDGLCVVLMEWEDKPAEARLMSGDARTPNYTVYAEGVLL